MGVVRWWIGGGRWWMCLRGRRGCKKGIIYLMLINLNWIDVWKHFLKEILLKQETIYIILQRGTSVCNNHI